MPGRERACTQQSRVLALRTRNPNDFRRRRDDGADRHIVRSASAGRMVDLPTEGRVVMSTVELVPVGALFSPARVAVAGFLAGYSGRTREAYALDVRMFGYWCTERRLGGRLS